MQLKIRLRRQSADVVERTCKFCRIQNEGGGHVPYEKCRIRTGIQSGGKKKLNGIRCRYRGK